MALTITHFTDPACPFAFSAEPVRQRLRWHYGEQLVWRTRMIVLTLEPGEAEKLAEGAPTLQRKYGMPIHPFPYGRPASSEPACRAFVAVRIHAPESAEAFLRRLRVRVMLGALIDEPELIAAAAREAGIDPAALARWSADDDVEAELDADIAAARDPSPAARALDHKLGGPTGSRRYTAPSYQITGADGDSFTTAGFNPVEVYETGIAHLAPDLRRRPAPESVDQALAWAGEPLATAEVALLMRLDRDAARQALAEVAHAEPAGADCYWTAAV